MHDNSKTRVLIANDDGIQSGYMHALACALAPYAEVFVFAPEVEQSGVGHAFTVRRGLALKKRNPVDVAEGHVEFYSMSGTPADCVKFALGHFATHGLSTEGAGPGLFDVCFSGVNLGENSGVSSLYSGTVAGAREAALWGVPGIALSLRGTNANMLDVAKSFAVSVVKNRLFEQIPVGTFWNVNFPKATAETFKGFKATKMALGMFTDHYSHEGNLWQLDGDKLWNEQPKDSDDYLLNQGYATITPHRIDQTDQESLEVINEMLEGGGMI
ncbi:5'/3'-nucleotidase SurE [Fibrobacter sp. UWB11]|uniref:5'/3'-nucleotidase SurE n=1 Tax=Fibrobacter sp. UWB11 TaxID=1896202 RepID=UPI00092C6EF3|nr:5'/3'-nucleotidase SurE [Fibrobacter sp. UWB11]SIO13498.1 5'-nucleotidase /3'-nucleotidase /exopolyphosphatase [Fibrobacter sp. UWB11]